MALINIIYFFLGVISFIIFKKFFKKKKIKYVKIKPVIENKKFAKASESILREQLDRNYLFFGEEGMDLIKDSTVAIINCENIGSNIAVTLARSGIKKLILIDNNILTIENYKYHPFAICEDINKKNLVILDDYIKQINPNIELILIKEKINFDNLSLYLDKKNTPNYIVECLNERNIAEKCKLIKYASDNHIKFISTFSPLSYQNNPTKIKHSLFSLAFCPRIINLILENYKKLYNSGVPDFHLVFSEQEKLEENFTKNENLFCYGVISDTASSIILCDLAKFETQKDIEINNKDEIKVGGKMLNEAIEEYKKFEIAKRKNQNFDLNYLTYNDFRLISLGFKNGSCLKQKPTPKMRFIRWRLYKEPARNNIVIMGKSEINSHLKINKEEELIKAYTKPVVDRIDRILNSLIDK